MLQIKKTIVTDHEDLIHDVSYDFYGERMATCSSDHRIKVWDKNPDGSWFNSAEWKAHVGSIWKVVWAHPEYGQVLASCSFDRTVVIWEEQINELGSKSKGKTSWVKRTALVDSRNSVKDIKFSPRNRGLQLATCSSDGFVRVYEALDIMNLSSWSLVDEFEERKGYACNCVSWNLSRTQPPLLAIGTSHSDVNLREYISSLKRWEVVATLVGHTQSVHDVQFAPTMGRSYQFLATASRDTTAIIWRISTSPGSGGTNSKSSLSYDCEILYKCEGHIASLWRVEWNITGTMLLTSGDDGTVRMWKPNYLGKWSCISVIRSSNDSEISSK